jgi:adenylate cyclase
VSISRAERVTDSDKRGRGLRPKRKRISGEPDLRDGRDLIRVIHPGGAHFDESGDMADDDVPPLEWLLAGASTSRTTRDLIRRLCARLTARGIPLLRATVFVRTLHPQTSGHVVVWWRQHPDPVEVMALRGIENTETFRDSPLPAIFEGAAAIRRRLDIENAALDYPVLHELKEAGATDYVAMPLTFSDGQINFLTWTSDRPGGFSTEDLALLYQLLPAFALRVELLEREQMTRQLLEIYLGRNAGRRVLAGAVERGKGESLGAVILFADLRGFTTMTDRLPRDEIIGLLDEFFECVTLPIDERGGEVMKFLGDGVLAIFPHAEPGVRAAADSALKAAQEAGVLIRSLNERRSQRGAIRLTHAMSLHIGEVNYGNIGSPDRLDFTVIGPAVNLANRLQTLSKRLGHSIVASADFAAAVGGGLLSAGWHPVRGLTEPVEVFRLPDAAE